MKRLLFLISIMVAFSLFLVACGGGESEETSSEGQEETSQDATTESEFLIEIGHIAPDEHSYTKGLEAFIEEVEERTDGRVTFEMYGNGQLGGERELIEQVQLGSLDMTMVTAGPLGNFVPELSVLEMPFLFEDLDHVDRVLDGDVGEDLMAAIDEQGFKTLGLWENGMRHLTNNSHPIYSPNDVEGLKMRTVENEIYIDSYQAIGADPTPVAFPEVYTSLQQGVVDGLDASYGVFYTTNLYEVQGHFSEAGYYYAAAPVIMNQGTFESLPEDIQEVFVEVARELTQTQRDINREMEAEQKEAMLEYGVEIVEEADVDIEAFRKASEEVYEKYEDRFGDLVERIRSM